MKSRKLSRARRLKNKSLKTKRLKNKSLKRKNITKRRNNRKRQSGGSEKPKSRFWRKYFEKKKNPP